jgi:hypothetical protein
VCAHPQGRRKVPHEGGSTRATPLDRRIREPKRSWLFLCRARLVCGDVRVRASANTIGPGTTRRPRVARRRVDRWQPAFEVGFGTFLIDLGRCGIDQPQRQGHQAEPPRRGEMYLLIVPPNRAEPRDGLANFAMRPMVRILSGRVNLGRFRLPAHLGYLSSQTARQEATRLGSLYFVQSDFVAGPVIELCRFGRFMSGDSSLFPRAAVQEESGDAVARNVCCRCLTKGRRLWPDVLFIAKASFRFNR